MSDFDTLFRYLMKYFPSTPDLKQLFGKVQKPKAPPPSEMSTPTPATTKLPANNDVSIAKAITAGMKF